MLTFSTSYLRDLVKEANPGNAAVASQVDSIDFLEFGHLEDSVKNDVKFLQESPLVFKDSITGWLYEVETGKVRKECFYRGGSILKASVILQIKQIV
jgi:carbonic anhydrase